MSMLFTHYPGYAPYQIFDYGAKFGAGSPVPPVLAPILTLTDIPTGGGVRTIFTTSEGGVTGFDIDYDGVVTTGVTSPRDYLIADMASNHQWRVRATNSYGAGPWSNYKTLGDIGGVGMVRTLVNTRTLVSIRDLTNIRIIIGVRTLLAG